MSIDIPLFEGKLIRLGPIDHEKDAEVESKWTHGNGFLRLGIGDPSERGRGYGSETLRLLLRFTFTGLNLYRLTALIPEYNTIAVHLFTKAGFIEEVRRRQALNRDGRRWDLIHLGLLREEWETSEPFASLRAGCSNV